MAEVEVQIDASRGAIVLKGEQSFVTELLEKYRFVFENAPKHDAKPAEKYETPITEKSPNNSIGSLADLSNVYDVEGENISILVEPPGKSMTAQAQALILLYLYARHKLGTEPAGIEQIKEQCKAHACFDQKNFSGHLKSQKSFVTVSGSNSSTMARLTVPGRKAAEDLAKKIQTVE